jgi:hypothetical protein
VIRGKENVTQNQSENTLDANQRQHIQALADKISTGLEAWVAAYPALRPERIPTSALVTATTAPKLEIDDAVLFAEMIVWLFGVDDISDKRIVSLAEFRQIGNNWHRFIQDLDVDLPDDDLTMALRDMYKRLRQAPLFAQLRENWAFQFGRILRAMAQEYENSLTYNAKGASSLPSLEAYINDGMYSIGLPYWSSVGMILMDDASVLDQFETIDPALQNAGAAIRLYNDVSTLEREIEEGKPNSIVILQHAILAEMPDMTPEQALAEGRAHILQLGDHYAAQCHSVMEQLDTDSHQLEDMLSRLLSFHAHFYTRTDYDYHIAGLKDALACLDVVYRSPLQTNR